MTTATTVLPTPPALSPSGTEIAKEHQIGPDEELISLADAARLLPRIAGKKVNLSTIWRWARVGLRGQYLAYMKIGRRIVTSQQALWRFFAAVAAQDQQLDPRRLAGPQFTVGQPITSRRRQRALAEADRVLERAGI
jgi:hypothetical protein